MGRYGFFSQLTRSAHSFRFYLQIRNTLDGLYNNGVPMVVVTDMSQTFVLEAKIVLKCI